MAYYGKGTTNQVLTDNTSPAMSSWQAAATGTVTSVTGTANRITSTGGTTPVIDISASYVGQSSITTLGTITTGVWNGTTIAVANGGTGNASQTAYSLVCGGTTTTGAFQAVADVATGSVLVSGGTGALPAFSATPTLTSVTFGSGAALSTFEQGTFSPTIRGSSTAGTVTMTTQVGRYQKVGRIVTVSFNIAWSTIGTATGAAQCNNLPYTVNNNASPGLSIAVNSSNPITTATSSVPMLQTNSNTTTANINYYTGPATNTAGTITASNGFFSTLTYETT